MRERERERERERGTWAASFSAFVPRLCFFGGQNGIFSC